MGMVQPPSPVNGNIGLLMIDALSCLNRSTSVCLAVLVELLKDWTVVLDIKSLEFREPLRIVNGLDEINQGQSQNMEMKECES